MTKQDKSVFTDISDDRVHIPILRAEILSLTQQRDSLQIENESAAEVIAAQKKVLIDWLACNGPGGWIDDLRKERDALKAALTTLQHGDAKCWCDFAIGNPMYPAHSAKCLTAKAALALAEGPQ